MFQTTVNVGLIIGIFVGIPVCILVVGCYAAKRSRRSVVRTRIVATNPISGATPVVTPNQASTSFGTRGQYPQHPVYKDAQFSCQNAPPPYADATAFPPSAEVTSNKQSYSNSDYSHMQVQCNISC